MKNLLTKCLCLVFAAGLLASCKTTKGFGRDLQHLGSKIERKAEQKSGY